MFINHKNILLIAAGNQKVFRQLMELTSDELLVFATGFLKNREIAEEVVSDVFVKIWKKRTELGKIKNLKSYLFISVKNGCLSHLRRLKNDKIISLDEIKDFYFLPVEDPEDDSVDKETVNKIYWAIEKLPPKCKLAFTLAKINGLKHKEIAEVMCISEKTVNNHIVSAVKKISETLKLSVKSTEPRTPFNQASIF